VFVRDTVLPFQNTLFDKVIETEDILEDEDTLTLIQTYFYDLFEFDSPFEEINEEYEEMEKDHKDRLKKLKLIKIQNSQRSPNSLTNPKHPKSKRPSTLYDLLNRNLNTIMFSKLFSFVNPQSANILSLLKSHKNQLNP